MATHLEYLLQRAAIVRAILNGRPIWVRSEIERDAAAVALAILRAAK